MTAALEETFDFDKTIEARMQTLSSLAQTIAKNPRGTLVPTSDSSPHSGKTALAALRKIQRDPSALRVEHVLGEGGMGIVHVGHQIALDRRVAVKTLRSEHVCDDNVESLLGEAWLAGSLEHPNVVPIYDLGLDPSGAPQLVMKRIEGDTWSDLLADPEATKRHAVGDVLEFHLRVIIQVCNAIHFAHSRSVIHRDLKPDNVMVGHFGEVYVLDWGVATRPGPIRHVAGTLVYMAPEMLGGLQDISARTDVYLLGALLYEVLTGHAPHEGANMQAMVASVLMSSPKFPESAPAELAAFATQCMQRDPALRPESALEVRRAIELYLEHRGASALAAQAEEKLVELEAILSASEVEVERAYGVFGECGFGFRQALRVWPESQAANDGMRRAISRMVRFEAQHGDVRAATRLLRELSVALNGVGDAELESLVEVARKREADEAKKIEKLRELEKDLDPRAGRQVRYFSGIGFGLLWAFAPLIAPSYLRAHPDAHEVLLTVPFSVLSVVIIVIGFLVVRTRTRINRQLMTAFTFALAAQPLALITIHDHIPSFDEHLTVAILCAYWFVVMGVIASALEWRLAPLPIAYAAAFIVAIRFPEWRYEGVGAANLIAALTVAVIWSRRATERAIAWKARREERGAGC